VFWTEPAVGRRSVNAERGEGGNPGKGDGPAFAMDTSGRKLVVEPGKDEQITVHVETAK
jgi:hypothetical protein